MDTELIQKRYDNLVNKLENLTVGSYNRQKLLIQTRRELRKYEAKHKTVVGEKFTQIYLKSISKRPGQA